MTKKMFSKKMALTATACAAALALTAVPAASAVTYVDETEPNDTIMTADSVGVGERVCAILTYSQDVDWYKISVPVAGDYTLSYVSNNDAGSKYINYYDNDRDERAYGYITTSNFATQRITRTLPAGVAYVKISRPQYNSGSDWQYELQLDYNPSTPALHTPKTTKTTLSAGWSKVKNATGYQVKVGGKTYKTSSNSIKVSGLKSKKIQSVKVRAYTTLEGKTFYGNWSVTKKVRTK